MPSLTSIPAGKLICFTLVRKAFAMCFGFSEYAAIRTAYLLHWINKYNYILKQVKVQSNNIHFGPLLLEDNELSLACNALQK